MCKLRTGIFGLSISLFIHDVNGFHGSYPPLHPLPLYNVSGIVPYTIKQGNITEMDQP